MWILVLLCFVIVVTKSCPNLCNLMKCTTTGSPVLHYLPEFAQIHVHWVSDGIQPSHPLSSPSPLAFNFPQHHLMSHFSFTSGGQIIGASASASVLPMNIQAWFPLELTSLIFLQSEALSRVFSSTTVWKHGFNFRGPKNMLSHWICHDAPEGQDISESFLLLDLSPSRRMVRQWFFSRSLMGNAKQLHRELKFTIF